MSSPNGGFCPGFHRTGTLLWPPQPAHAAAAAEAQAKELAQYFRHVKAGSADSGGVGHV